MPPAGHLLLQRGSSASRAPPPPRRPRARSTARAPHVPTARAQTAEQTEVNGRAPGHRRTRRRRRGQRAASRPRRRRQSRGGSPPRHTPAAITAPTAAPSLRRRPAGQDGGGQAEPPPPPPPPRSPAEDHAATATVTPAPAVSGHTFCCTCQLASHHSFALGVYWAICPVIARAAAAGSPSPAAAASPAATTVALMMLTRPGRSASPGAAARPASREHRRHRLHRVHHAVAGTRPGRAVGGRLDPRHDLRLVQVRVVSADQRGDPRHEVVARCGR